MYTLTFRHTVLSFQLFFTISLTCSLSVSSGGGHTHTHVRTHTSTQAPKQWLHVIKNLQLFVACYQGVVLPSRLGESGQPCQATPTAALVVFPRHSAQHINQMDSVCLAALPVRRHTFSSPTSLSCAHDRLNMPQHASTRNGNKHIPSRLIWCQH